MFEFKVFVDDNNSDVAWIIWLASIDKNTLMKEGESEFYQYFHLFTFFSLVNSVSYQFENVTFWHLWVPFISSTANAFDLDNPFPNKPLFLHVCSTCVLKPMWKMEKLLETSNFSFSHSVFYWCFENFLHFSSNLKLSSANYFRLEEP